MLSGPYDSPLPVFPASHHNRPSKCCHLHTQPIVYLFTVMIQSYLSSHQCPLGQYLNTPRRIHETRFVSATCHWEKVGNYNSRDFCSTTSQPPQYKQHQSGPRYHLVTCSLSHKETLGIGPQSFILWDLSNCPYILILSSNYYPQLWGPESVWTLGPPLHFSLWLFHAP